MIPKRHHLPRHAVKPLTLCAAAAALLLASLCAPAQAQAQHTHSHAPADRALPALGDAGLMTPLQERKLGDAVARELFRDPAYLDDPVLDDYVDALWRPLLAAARERGDLPPELDERYAWRVLLGRDASINAFALPGGYFGLHTGLVGVTASRDELASVLAHEMAHITQRHIPRMIGRQERHAPLLLAAMVLGAMAASKNPQAGAAVVTGGQAAFIQQSLNYSRDMEREADRIGHAIHTRAGFSPQGAIGIFEKLQHAARLDDNGQWPYLRSHPLTTQRLAEAQQRQPAAPAPQTSAAAADLPALLLAARARVLGRPGVNTLRAWAQAPAAADFASQPLPKRAPALYAAALAHAHLRDLPRAQTLAEQLAQAVASTPPALQQVRLLQAELALQASQPQKALQWLDEAVAPPASPGRARLLLRAQALTQIGQAPQASAALQTWLASHPQDASAWQALAQAWHAQGHTLRALRAEGEVPMARMDYAGAIDRWRAAQDHARQHGGSNASLIEASIIDTRLRAAQQAQKQLEEDEDRHSPQR